MMSEAEITIKFRELILRLPESALDDRYPPHPDLLLNREGPFEVFYAPLDYINTSARITIVGLTPGRHTMFHSLAVAKSHLNAGYSWEEAQKAAKLEGAFSNARGNLSKMLDYVGLCEWLRGIIGDRSVASCRDLFGTASAFVQLTSVIRYPTFFRGKNYSGNPDPLNNTFLRQMINSIFGNEVQQLRDSVFVPLGETVSRVFEYLRVEDKRVLYGLPHPSGANNERINYFLEKKPRELLSSKTNPAKIDASRTRLKAKLIELLKAVSVS